MLVPRISSNKKPWQQVDLNFFFRMNQEEPYVFGIIAAGGFISTSPTSTTEVLDDAIGEVN